ncbi:hypothetical protein HCY66_14940 [Acinetobacter radioresistens]|uniref:hypothetical protein n=1 Tax=Acinetobacter radioresistens TaxID=40216 RepID=UPI0020063053|nr:hypothetical protein [Acinetobacter radioresistens]MCK4091350.1 hypothetical protein [Acinetobacter radioresistens]
MKAQAIIQASNVEDLKKLGSYKDVKDFLEKEFDTRLGGRSWISLFKKLKLLKDTFSSQEIENLSKYKDETLSDSKKRISRLLAIEIKAKTHKELEMKVKKLFSFFSFNGFDPYEYYEKTKFSKFQNSSNLEGLKIDIPNPSTSLESIIAKYQR